MHHEINASKNEDFPHPFGPAKMMSRVVSGIARTFKSVKRLKSLICIHFNFMLLTHKLLC